MPPVPSSRLFTSCWQMEAQQPALGAGRDVQARQGSTATTPREKTDKQVAGRFQTAYIYKPQSRGIQMGPGKAANERK